MPEIAVTDLPDDAVVLDVREPGEWARGHVPNAVHLPMGEVSDQLANLPKLDGPLPVARKMGATATVNVAAEPERLKAEYGAEKGAFDVMFEASGNQHALTGAFDVVRPGGVIVQIGVGGQFTLPMNVVVAKEFDLRGSFRFHEEFDWAVAMIGLAVVPRIAFKVCRGSPPSSRSRRSSIISASLVA